MIAVETNYARKKQSLPTNHLSPGTYDSGSILRSLFSESMLCYLMSKAVSFTRRGPDNITEELVAVLSCRASFEFTALFDVILANLRERNAASGGEEMLRLRAYEKLQSLVNQGAVTKTVTGITKKYKGVNARLLVLNAEMKVLRAEWSMRGRRNIGSKTRGARVSTGERTNQWNQRVLAKAAARN